MSRAAVFLDRDGTVIEHVHHLTNASDVRLIERAAEAIRQLQQANYACVIVTNQSVVGRGMLTLNGLDSVHEAMDRQLAEHGVSLDGLYFSSHVPTQKDPTVIEHPDRKPGPGMLQRAAAELGLDLARSWMIGDSISDIHAGRNAGCRGSILVRTGVGHRVSVKDDAIDFAASDLYDAAQYILKRGGGTAPPREQSTAQGRDSSS